MTDASTNGGNGSSSAYHDDVAASVERMRSDVRTARELGDDASAFDVVIGGIARGLAGHRRIEAALAKAALDAAEERGMLFAALARIERVGLTTQDVATVGLEVAQLALARSGAGRDSLDRELDSIAKRLRDAEQRRRETTAAEDLQGQAALAERVRILEHHREARVTETGSHVIINVDRASQHEIEPLAVVAAKGTEARKTERTKTALTIAVLVVTAALSLVGAHHLGERAGEKHHEPAGPAHHGE